MSKLIDKNVEKILENCPLYSNVDNDNLIAVVKFFNPFGLGTWYVVEAEKQLNGDYLFYGYVESPITPEFNEFGYFTLFELESVGIIERDIYFEPTPLKELLHDNNGSFKE